MDFHPIVVHFPIALLTLYAVFELIRFRKVLEKPYWFNIKAILVIFGAISALLAVLTSPGTGGVAIVEMHEKFAFASLAIFGIIAISYILEWFKPIKISGFILKPYIIIPLALLGLICITITGGLGGAIVYGTKFDPFMAPIFKLLNVY